MPKWFKFFGAVLFLLIIAFSITNAVFYSMQIDNKDIDAPITSSNATILMWINIVLAVLSGFALIYFGMRIYKGDPEKTQQQIVGVSEDTKIGYSLDNQPTPATQQAAAAEQDRITELENRFEELLKNRPELGFNQNDQPLTTTPTPTGGSTLAGGFRDATIQSKNPDTALTPTPSPNQPRAQSQSSST